MPEFEPRRSLVVQARIRVTGTDAGVLGDWLRREPELRGRLSLSGRPSSTEDMGVGTDVVVQVAATVTGASVVWAALAKSLTVWLMQRRSDVKIEVIGPEGRKVSLDAKRVVDAEKLLRGVLEATSSSNPSNPPTEVSSR